MIDFATLAPRSADRMVTDCADQGYYALAVSLCEPSWSVYVKNDRGFWRYRGEVEHLSHKGARKLAAAQFGPNAAVLYNCRF